MDLIVPLTVKYMAFNEAPRESGVGDFDSLLVGFLIKPGVNLKTTLSPRVSNTGNDNFVRFQRHASPVCRDVTEKPVFDFVPLAGAGRVVANFNDQSCFVCQLLPF